MYKKNSYSETGFNVNNSSEGETIEEKMHRIVNNKEPIKDGAPLIYQERSEGVKAGYDIRTDRWEVAIDAMDVQAKAMQAKREEKGKVINMPKDPSGESTQATSNNESN